jgi:hypothetical protein
MLTVGGDVELDGGRAMRWWLAGDGGGRRCTGDWVEKMVLSQPMSSSAEDDRPLLVFFLLMFKPHNSSSSSFSLFTTLR